MVRSGKDRQQVTAVPAQHNAFCQTVARHMAGFGSARRLSGVSTNETQSA